MDVNFYLKKVCRNAVSHDENVVEGELAAAIKKSIVAIPKFVGEFTPKLKELRNLNHLENASEYSDHDANGLPSKLITELDDTIVKLQEGIENRNKAYEILNKVLKVKSDVAAADAKKFKTASDLCLEEEGVLVEAIMLALEEKGCSSYFDEKVSVAQDFNFVQHGSRNKCSFKRRRKPDAGAGPTYTSKCLEAFPGGDFSETQGCQNGDLRDLAKKAKDVCAAATAIDESLQVTIKSCMTEAGAVLAALTADDATHINNAMEAFTNIKANVDKYDVQVLNDWNSVLAEISKQKKDAGTKYNDACKDATETYKLKYKEIIDNKEDDVTEDNTIYSDSTAACHDDYLNKLEQAYLDKLKVVSKSDFDVAQSLKKTRLAHQEKIKVIQNGIGLLLMAVTKDNEELEDIRATLDMLDHDKAAAAGDAAAAAAGKPLLDAVMKHADNFKKNCEEIPAQVRDHLQDSAGSIFYISDKDTHNYIKQENDRHKNYKPGKSKA